MIRIRHNGAERSADPAGLASLAELVAWSCETAGREGDVVVHCSVNGMALDEGRMAALGEVPIAQVAEVELTTRPPAAVALDGLASAREYAGRVRAALRRTGELFREGRVEDANHLYADVLDALSVLVFAAVSAGQQLGERGAPLHDLEAQVRPWLAELLDAQGVHDWVRVADYLEYELDPILADWERRMDAVRGGAAPPATVEAGRA